MRKRIFFTIGVLFLVVGSCFYFNYNFLPYSSIKIDNIEYTVGFNSIDSISESILESLQEKEYNLILSDGSKLSYKLCDFTDMISVNEMCDLLNEKYNGIFDIGKNNYTILGSDIYTFNDEKLKNILLDIQGINEVEKESENAYIGYDLETDTFKIFPEVYGNILVDNSLERLKECLLDYSSNSLDLVSEGLYVKPSICSTDQNLINNLDYYNSYIGWSLSYKFGEKEETLTLSDISDWLIPNYIEGSSSLDPDLPFSVSDEKVSDFVSTLNKKYTTFGSVRKFTTSTGEVVTLSTGDYGWWLNTSEMKKSIIEKIESVESGVFESIYRQKAESYGDLDFTDTYVEISISEQHIWMYVDGKLIVDSGIVTGNINNGWGTRKGVFSLTYKERNATLNGPGYSTPVSYWMPFDGNIGLHDATWRSSFGGSIYKSNGSHGCVNLPFNTAKTIYENITSTTPIIVW